ncbi:PREDICTED: complement component C1q receptor-like [Nanorana parkeri]|uniref:complement component C1q receptor-like n=1 Tax=Nanorana parkeri TaxID=125878 RepID=UPI000854F591|nr:PREDICTED: complement component C1q receptor-like [Nanorana parkeri]
MHADCPIIKRIYITNVITLIHPFLKCLWISMRFLSLAFSRRDSARKRTRGEQRRMLIFIAGLLLLTYLPVSNGGYDEKQGAAFCSGNACYTVHLSKAKFSEAHNNCANRGGYLVTIKSEKEAELVHTILLELTKNPQFTQSLNLWIGLKLKQCVIKHDLLKGFFWTTGDENAEKSQFSNWMSDPKSTCTKEMCVSMKLHTNPLDNFKWVDSLCSALFDGYICKFDFQGMCQPLVLAGPGIVNYETSFSFKSASLNLLPYASFGYVSCGHQKNGNVYNLMCKDMEESGTTVYQWVDPRSNKYLGALCVSEEHGCNYNNGGCQHKCTTNSEKGSILCECNDGYVLAPDLVSCVLPDHCESHQCEHNCINHPHGHECTCKSGFVLAEDKKKCLDINECLEGPCNHTCSNTYGSFQCHCPPGLLVRGTHCLDIDECILSPCSQGCLNTYGSYFCSCSNGYVLSDEKSCLDVDECVNSPCAYSCENIPGSYKCTCQKGFKLSSDRISCIPELQNAHIPPSGHEDKDSGTQNRETTSNGQRDMTNQPTPTSVFQATFTEKEDKRQMILSTPASSESGSYPNNSSVNQVISDRQDGYSIVLLVSILSACGVVLVLLIVAGGFLCYRRRNTKKKETEKQSSATDKYCWVPESEDKANKDFR